MTYLCHFYQCRLKSWKGITTKICYTGPYAKYNGHVLPGSECPNVSGNCIVYMGVALTEVFALKVMNH